MDVGVGVLAKQVSVGLEGVVHFDFGIVWRFAGEGVELPGGVVEGDGEIVNAVERARECFAVGQRDLDGGGGFVGSRGRAATGIAARLKPT